MRKQIYALLAGIMSIILLYQILYYGTRKEIVATVTGKERLLEKSGKNLEGFYVIYTDKGTFKLVDDWVYGNFQPSDVYGNIKEKATYKFTVAGWRSGFLSTYPNILKAEEIDETVVKIPAVEANALTAKWLRS